MFYPLSSAFKTDSAMADPTPYLIVIGFGVPGRAVVDMALERQIDHCIVESNAATVKRCGSSRGLMIAGDARDPAVLKEAHIERATIIVIAIPDQEAALQITRLSRALNATATIVTRCHYISVGFEARAAGADHVIIAEQVVAYEMTAVVSPLIVKSEPPYPNP
jgi:CPA2 family monovalent cation:H+ antiporter-2